MRKILILLLLGCIGCDGNGPSGRTVCPCIVTKVSKVKEGYEITVKGRALPSSESYHSEFTFTTTQSHIIGDEIK